jgi:hypothetical protein
MVNVLLFKFVVYVLYMLYANYVLKGVTEFCFPQKSQFLRGKLGVFQLYVLSIVLHCFSVFFLLST